MKIIVLSKTLKSPAKISLGRVASVLAFLAVVGLPSALFLYAGYYWGMVKGQEYAEAMPYLLQDELSKQRQKLEESKLNVNQSINALAVRLGEMQAHMIRLDTLGKRLVKVAGLEKSEFNFDKPMAQGGPEEPALPVEAVNLNEFAHSLELLSHQIEDRSQQLEILEAMLINRSLQQAVTPAGQPVKNGWLSSYFGLRSDPFTGHMAHHMGVDIAGSMGDQIQAVGAGVVTWSGERSGYGNLVEVSHGNGYVTRYAHNSQNLVVVGETIKKGQVVALMGTSGRSTGPHLHFEVLYNGKFVNPVKYLTTAQR